MDARALNRRLKRWPSWAVLVLAVAALLAVGATRDTGPRTPGERVDDISRRVACPVCQGESVYESRNNASESIRAEIRAQVAEARKSDDEIIEFIAERYGGQILLVPRSSGIEALVWAIPAAAFVIGVAGLTVAFRRWQAEAAVARGATEADYTLVASALTATEPVSADTNPVVERSGEDVAHGDGGDGDGGGESGVA